MVLSWSERDAGDLEAHFLEGVSTDSSEESSPPAPQEDSCSPPRGPFVFPNEVPNQEDSCSPPRPFIFPREAPFKLFGSGLSEPTRRRASFDDVSHALTVDESSEEAKFRNGVTGKYVSDGKGSGRYITGNSTYVRGEGNVGGIEDGDEVSLKPLHDQVGGHTRLLLLNSATICKPLNPRELDFYENLPADIQEFVPSYKGESN